MLCFENSVVNFVNVLIWFLIWICKKCFENILFFVFNCFGYWGVIVFLLFIFKCMFFIIFIKLDMIVVVVGRFFVFGL